MRVPAEGDLEGDAAALGKATGKDARAGKGTLIDAIGNEGARARLAKLVGEAEGALAMFGAEAAILKAAARFIAARRA